MELTNEERALLDGIFGSGIQRCMSLLVRWGEMFDAERMIKVSHVHLSTSIPYQLLEEMSEDVDKVRVPSSLHAAFDPDWFVGRLGTVLKGDLARGSVIDDDSDFIKRIRLLNKLGFLPSFTCAPYTAGIVPRSDDVLCWTGSSGQVICNSFFGTRSGRESAATSFASAITGRTPYMGLLKKENRYARILVELKADLNIDKFTEADYGALGYYIGEIASYNNIAIKGIPKDITLEKGRMFVSPLPVSGACTICHIIGVTPEAPTLEEAFGNKKPEDVVHVGQKELREGYDKLTNADKDQIDMVVIGCPHLTIGEVAELASFLEGKTISQDVRLLIGIANPVYSFAHDAGFVPTIQKAGGTFMNICVAAANRLIFPEKLPRTIATNSARAAHYIQRMTAGRSRTVYGDMKLCAELAITGKKARYP
jgi:predicted aconitase